MEENNCWWTKVEENLPELTRHITPEIKASEPVIIFLKGEYSKTIDGKEYFNQDGYAIAQREHYYCEDCEHKSYYSFFVFGTDEYLLESEVFAWMPFDECPFEIPKPEEEQDDETSVFAKPGKNCVIFPKGGVVSYVDTFLDYQKILREKRWNQYEEYTNWQKKNDKVYGLLLGLSILFMLVSLVSVLMVRVDYKFYGLLSLICAVLFIIILGISLIFSKKDKRITNQKHEWADHICEEALSFSFALTPRDIYEIMEGTFKTRPQNAAFYTLSELDNFKSEYDEFDVVFKDNKVTIFGVINGHDCDSVTIDMTNDEFRQFTSRQKERVYDLTYYDREIEDISARIKKRYDEDKET